jgi:hypothetical protein
MIIFGLCGLQGAGKDTAADYFVKKGFISLSFASLLKDVVSILFEMDREMLEGKTSDARKKREIVDEWWSKRLGIPNFTPRYALQFIGTDLFRNHFNDDFWLICVEKKILKYSKVIITDARFCNEIEMIEKLGGKMIHVIRGNLPEWFEKFRISLDVKLLPESLHKSEWTWITKCPSCKIYNNGTIDDLHDSIDKLFFLNEEKTEVR